MTADELRMLQGANALVQSVVETTARELLAVQLELGRVPYAALRLAVGPTCLAHGIAKTQETITRGVYGSVVLGSRVAYTVAAAALALWE